MMSISNQYGVLAVADAETGTIHIQDLNTYTWSNSGGVNTGWNMTLSMQTIYWDTADFGYISNFALYMPDGVSFANSYGSSSFQIVSGGSGSGTAWYDQSTKKIYIVFDSADIFTSSPLTLQYSNSSVWGEITSTSGRLSADTPTVTHPLCIRGYASQCIGTTTTSFVYQDVNVGFDAYDFYNVSYPPNGLFSISILKNQQVASRYRIESLTGLYSAENVFNKINISNAIFVYGAGIVLNVSVLNGVYTKTTINLTTVNLPDAEGTGNISFQYAYYYIGESPKIFWNLSGTDLTTWVYHVDLIDPDNIVRESKLITASGNFTSGMTLDKIGVWTSKLYACGYGLCSVNKQEIADSSTQIFGSTSESSYIFFSKKTYDATETTNITYLVDDVNWTEWFTSFYVQIVDTQENIVREDELYIQNSTILIPLSVGTYYARLKKYYPCWTLICEKTLSQDTTTVFKNIVNQNNTDTTTAGFGLKLTISQDCWENVKGVIYTPNPTPANTIVEMYNSSNISIYTLPVTSTIQSFSVGFTNQTGIIRAELKNTTKIHDRQTFRLYTCVVPTPTPPPISPENIQSNDFWNGLVSIMGMGTGGDAKLFFAILIISVLSICGFLIVGDKALILSFGFYIWFTYINFIPKWIFILVVIILVSASKIFR